MSESQEAESLSEQMVDPFGRQVRYLRISVTDRCNLRCFYCMPNGLENKYQREEVLRLEEIIRLSRVFSRLGAQKIRLTGGEPLYRKGVVEMISELRELPGIQELCMTTNALALAAQAEGLKAGGLDRVNVSLDTLDRQRFQDITRYDGLEKVLAGIEKALEVGLEPVKINVVVMRGVNDDEVVDFADWAFRAPVRVRFIEYMPFGPGIPGQQKSYVPSSELIRKIQKKYDLEAIPGRINAGPSCYYRAVGAAGELGFISPIDSGFCDSCNRVRLTSIGTLRLCLFHDDGIDLRTPLRDGASDQDLEGLIREALKIKPERHHLQEGIPYEGLAMSQVGG
jgi:cyclic pyranopterin phosphate synthase